MADAVIQELIEAARPLLGEMRLAREDMSAATVACALRSASGRIYTGVCLHLCSGVGFCAEHAAVAEMIKGRETRRSSRWAGKVCFRPAGGAGS